MKMQNSEEIIFKPYTEDSLIFLIHKLLGIHKCLFNTKAINYIARYVAIRSGDARLFLDFIRSTIHAAQHMISEDMLAKKNVSDAVVKMNHVMAGMKASRSLPTINLIESLPSKAKIILAVLTSLHTVSKSWSIVSTSKLKTFCSEACRHEMFHDDGIDTESFHHLIEHLNDAGLVDTSIKGRYSSNHIDEFDTPIRVGPNVGSYEVEIALGTSLFEKNSFYSKLKQYVIDNDINNK